VRSVVVTRRASHEIEEAGAWWRANRPAAPDLFLTELSRALQLVAASPEIGALATNSSLRGVRRVLLSRIRYHLYYRVESDTVEVLALWHASRRSGPSV
jgi:plasmid stabilization system protein ParE